MPAPNFTFAELEGLWIQAGGSPAEAAIAAAIATAESSACQYALAGPVDVRPVQICKLTITSGEDSRGLWQVNLAAHPEFAGQDLFDPLVNARAAVRVREVRGDFTAWTTFTTPASHPAYLDFLPAGTVQPVRPLGTPGPGLQTGLVARPPKINAWSAGLVLDAPDVFAVKPNVPSTWTYWCGAIGYWLPNALNRSAQARAQIRMLR